MASRRRAFTWLVVAAAAVLGCSYPAAPSLAASAGPLSISVAANQLVNGAGQVVRLLGVDRESTEYACQWGQVASGPIDAGDAAVIAGWGADAVRIPLNEDCWLGINGLPADGLSASEYQAGIKGYVADLNADGIYAILDLHWSAPGADQSLGQYPMPDDHSTAFWASVANAFAENRAVVFDAFNEPYSPAADGWSSSYAVSWTCWEDGGCAVPAEADGTTPFPGPPTYAAVGMQALVDAIRATGATQPIMLGGLAYANDLSAWLQYEPRDPAAQLVASFHTYTGEACDDVACWDSTIAPLAKRVPVVTGEFDEDDCPSGGGSDPANFDNTYMAWADAHAVSYLAWGWLVLDPPVTCSSLTLISDYGGTPAGPNGVALRGHLLALAASAPASGDTSPGAGATPGGGTGPSGAPTATLTVGELDGALAQLIDRHEHLAARLLARVRGTAWSFAPPTPGTLRLRLIRGTTIEAAGIASFLTATSGEVSLELTTAGRRLLARRGRTTLRAVATYAAVGGLSGTADADVVVRRDP